MSRSIGVILEVEGLGPTGNPPPEKQRSAIGLAFRLGLEKWMAVAHILEWEKQDICGQGTFIREKFRDG